MNKRNVFLDILRSAAALSNTLLWHVPVFFMITGYLWLQNDKECTLRKMIPNIRRFIYVLLTIGFAYAVIERFFHKKSFSLSLLTDSILDVFIGNLWDHMWYLYAIIGLSFAVTYTLRCIPWIRKHLL